VLSAPQESISGVSAVSDDNIEKVSESEAFEAGKERIKKELEYERDTEELSYGAASLVRIEDNKYNDDITILKVSGHLDSSSTGELESIMEDLYEEGIKNIIVDLTNVQYISSGGWGVFVSRVKNLREKEGDVVLMGMSAEVYDIFEMLGFMDILMQFRLKEEALEFLSLPFRERQKHLKVKRKSRKKKKSEKKLIPEGSNIEMSEVTPLQIKAGLVGHAGEITVLELKGIVDTVSSLELREVLERLLKKGTRKIIADMSGVEYVSSAGWGVFSSRIDRLREKGGDLKIFGMDSEVNRIFMLLEFDEIMHSFNILAEAVEDFNVEIALTGGNKDDPGSESAVVITGKKGHIVDDYTFRIDLERVEVSGNGGGVILEVAGAIDASTNDEFEINLEKSVVDNPAFLIIDLSDVVYINSSGWGNIAKYVQQMNNSGMKLALTGMNPAVYKIFTDLGFEPLIPHFNDRGEAISDMADSPGVKKVLSEVQKSASREEDLSEEVIPNDDKQNENVEERVIDGDKRQKSGILYSTLLKEEDYINPVSAKEENVDGVSGELPEEDINPSYLNMDIERDQVDKREEKDKKIRDIGWGEYGKKLYNKNKKGEKGPDE